MTVIPGYEMPWVSYAQVTYPSLGTQSKRFLLRVGMKKFSESKIRSPQSEEKDLPVGQMVKNLPARQETWVRSLDGEDPLEKGMATHSSILAWRIPWTEEPGRLQFVGLQRVEHDWIANTSLQSEEIDVKTINVYYDRSLINSNWKE